MTTTVIINHPHVPVLITQVSTYSSPDADFVHTIETTLKPSEHPHNVTISKDCSLAIEELHPYESDPDAA